MHPTQHLRERFADGGLGTASPAKIVVMAYDRLDRDLAGAIVALESRSYERSHELLCHAQDLTFELLCMLDLEAWEYAPNLASIYRYVIELLTSANVHKTVKEANEARSLLAGMGDAFRQAVAQMNVTAGVPTPDPRPEPLASAAKPAPMFAAADPGGGRFSVRA